MPTRDANFSASLPESLFSYIDNLGDETKGRRNEINWAGLPAWATMILLVNEVRIRYGFVA